MSIRYTRIAPLVAVVLLVIIAAITFTSQTQDPPPQPAPEPAMVAFSVAMDAAVVEETSTPAPPTPPPPPRAPEFRRTSAHDRADAFISALLSQAQKHRERGFENAAVGSEDFAAFLAWSAYTPRRENTPLQVAKIKVLHPSVFKVTVAIPPAPHAIAAGHGALFASAPTTTTTTPTTTAAPTKKRSSSRSPATTAANSAVEQSPQQKEEEEAVVPTRNSTFVLKSECRPALPYDGQQALGEIGAAYVLESIFGLNAAYGPYGWVNGARGVVVEVSAQQFGHMLARGGGAGRCGLLSGHDLAAAEIHPDRWERIYFAGAALQWNPVHYDDAMPHPDSMEYFLLPRLDELNNKQHPDAAATALPAPVSLSVMAPPSPQAAKRGRQERHPALAKDPAELEALRQMSDVLVVDFVAQSSDRVDHNWFRTAGATADVEALVRDERRNNITRVSYGFPSTAELANATEEKRERFHSGKHFDVAEKPQLADMSTRTSRMLYMDNGWAFAGLAFVHSVCDADDGDLRVPRTLRFFNGTQACNTYSTDLTTCPPPKLKRPPWPLCRFRSTTVDLLKSLTTRWGVAPADAPPPPETTAAPVDPNATTAAPTPAPILRNAGTHWAELVREDPLMRLMIRRYRGAPDVIGGQPFQRGGMQPLNVVLSRFTHDCPAIGSPGIVDAADLLALGVGRRLRALARHVDWCVKTYGPDEVLL